ncbi:MAG: hypothetical protein ACOYJI_03740 [Anaerovoracaceae bacterium]|jgi:hypothetical protein
MEKFLICVDDTDDVTKRTSTGEITEKIGKRLEMEGGRIIDGISRHQLLLSEAVRYTSHNSSMCLEMEFEEIDPERIVEVCEEIIRHEMASTADPGLAVCSLRELADPEPLIVFGVEAKKEVKRKQEAYQLAERTDGVFLEELGGSGDGVIGALAGIGLRLSRSDGSLRGKKAADLEGKSVSADELCRRTGAEAVVTSDGRTIGGNESVYVSKFVKLMYFNGRKCIFVIYENGRYEVMWHHEEREKILDDKLYPACENFESDNDEEECVIPDGMKSCFNCLYRRWSANGFECMLPEAKII